MLRSRGNRLPSERAELAASLSSPSRSIAAAAAPAGSRSIVAAAPRLSPLPLSYSAAAPASRSIARRRYREDLRFFFSLLVIPRVREEEDRVRTRFPSSLSLSHSLSDISSPDRLYRPVDFSSVFRDRASRWSSSAIARYRCTRTHTRRGALFPQRTAPFFETPGRDSSPISFRSPVIN